MSKITIAGNAVIVTAETKLTDLQKIQRYNPKALTLMGGEDNKEPVFRVVVTPGVPGSIDSFGAEFGAATRDESAKATMTMALPAEAGDDVVSYVADKLGAAITALNKLEAGFPAVLQQIDADRAAVMANITVLG